MLCICAGAFWRGVFCICAGALCLGVCICAGALCCLTGALYCLAGSALVLTGTPTDLAGCVFVLTGASKDLVGSVLVLTGAATDLDGSVVDLTLVLLRVFPVSKLLDGLVLVRTAGSVLFLLLLLKLLRVWFVLRSRVPRLLLSPSLLLEPLLTVPRLPPRVLLLALLCSSSCLLATF